jgi:hypothetical protein
MLCHDTNVVLAEHPVGTVELMDDIACPTCLDWNEFADSEMALFSPPPNYPRIIAAKQNFESKIHRVRGTHVTCQTMPQQYFHGAVVQKDGCRFFVRLKTVPYTMICTANAMTTLRILKPFQG